MKFVITLVLLFSVNSFANNWYDRGNGGFVLQCANQKLQVLDLYEAGARFNLSVVPTQATTTVDKVKELLSRLAGKDPQRAEVLNAWLANFFKEQQLVQGSFARTPDLGAVVIPDGCELQQVIVQQQPSVVNPFRYLINAKLWNQLDTDNQAALILHELIYREFISTPSQEFSSERIRYFNAFIHANLPGVQSLQDYVTKLQEVHIGRFQYRDLMLFLGAANSSGEWISSPVNFEEDLITFASLSSQQAIGKNYFRYSCFNNEANPRLGSAFISKSGQLVSVDIDTSLAASFACSLPSFQYSHNGSSFIVSGSKWKFDANEQVTEVAGPSTSHTQIDYMGNSFTSAGLLVADSVQETIFRFDKKMNLIELGLGGGPCHMPTDSTISFMPNLPTWDSSVTLDAGGKITNKIRACF